MCKFKELAFSSSLRIAGLHDYTFWQIQTVAVGAAIGQACLLLASGDKGMRFMMPHATGMLVSCLSLCAVHLSRTISCYVDIGLSPCLKFLCSLGLESSFVMKRRFY